MPEIDVKKPFNFREGVEVKQYKTGKHKVSADVAAHAKAHGFIVDAFLTPAPSKAAEKQ